MQRTQGTDIGSSNLVVPLRYHNVGKKLNTDEYVLYEPIKTGSFVKTWMDLESLIQSEVISEKEKDKYCILTYISRKMVQINLFAGQEYRQRHGE